MKLIFDKSVPDRRGVTITRSDVATTVNIKKEFLRNKPAQLAELSELDVVRHFTELSRRNFGVDTNFYPLGSCTMKYNPKVTERIAAYPGFAHLHPLLPQLRGGGMLTQGALAVLYEMDMLPARDNRYGGLHDAADGRRTRRTDRHNDYGRLSSRQRQQKNHRSHP